MTPEELYALLSGSFPTCYYDFSGTRESERPKAPPYCAILEGRAGGVAADDKRYYSEPAYIVELYTTRKDYLSEQTLEQLFDDNDIYYDKAAKVFLRDEKKMQIIYTI